MKLPLNRRQFIRHTAAATVGIATIGAAQRKLSANDKLNIGIVGVANQGDYDMTNVASENIVALCDIDDKWLAAAAQKFPQAKTYNDFRRLLDQADIDAVVVATPDHTHAVAAVAALKSGRHLYCEKPLARTVSETRIITETAHREKRVTQIGTQIHAGSNYRRVVELIQSGAIGRVWEVHVWVNATYGGHDRPRETPPVPPNVHYDLWLGPVESVAYSPEYLPFKWRNWWAFGGGALADFGCHYMDLPFWALELSRPSTIEVEGGPPVHPDSTPPWLIVRYRFPARKEKSRQRAQGRNQDLPPVELVWYHGGKQPSRLTPEQAGAWKSGVLFVGEKGELLADYSRHRLFPEKDFAGFTPPAPFIPDSIGHHREWIEACKSGTPTTCGFEYSGPLTEAVLLGNVAYRSSRRLEWDWKNLRAVNCPEADRFIRHEYRKGWKI
jgi:predicted dehydrogenase